MFAHTPFQLNRILDAFKQRRIAMPKPVTAAVAVFERITKETPTEPSPTALRDVILAGGDAEAIGSALLFDLGTNRLSSAWSQAANEAAGRAINEIQKQREPLHAALAKQATTLIEQLERLAGIDQPLDSLIRSGDTEGARLVADRDLIANDLHACYQLRDEALFVGTIRAAQVGGFDASRWRNIDKISSHIHGGSLAEQFISGVKGGGRLWFPTLEQAVEAATAMWDSFAVAEAKRKEAAFGSGSWATFT